MKSVPDPHIDHYGPAVDVYQPSRERVERVYIVGHPSTLAGVMVHMQAVQQQLGAPNFELVPLPLGIGHIEHLGQQEFRDSEHELVSKQLHRERFAIDVRPHFDLDDVVKAGIVSKSDQFRAMLNHIQEHRLPLLSLIEPGGTTTSSPVEPPPATFYPRGIEWVPASPPRQFPKQHYQGYMNSRARRRH